MDGSDEDTPLLVNSSPRVSNDEQTAILQATVFIEDGIHYRSIHHKIDQRYTCSYIYLFTVV